MVALLAGKFFKSRAAARPIIKLSRSCSSGRLIRSSGLGLRMAWSPWEHVKGGQAESHLSGISPHLRRKESDTPLGHRRRLTDSASKLGCIEGRRLFPFPFWFFTGERRGANKDIKMMDSVHLIPECDRVIFQLGRRMGHGYVSEC